MGRMQLLYPEPGLLVQTGAQSEYQELVDAHAGVDGNLATKVALKLVLLHAVWRVVRQQLREPLKTPQEEGQNQDEPDSL